MAAKGGLGETETDLVNEIKEKEREQS